MEALLKSTISLLQKYLNGDVEGAVPSQLQNNLNALCEIAKEPKECLRFGHADTHLVDCLHSLVNLLTQPFHDRINSLARSSFTFIFHICSINVELREFIQENYNIPPVLRIYLEVVPSSLVLQSNYECIKEHLMLLQIVTYGLSSSRGSECCELIPFLVTAVLNWNSEEPLSYVLGTLANLCNASMTFRQRLKQTDYYRSFCKRLADLTGSANIGVVMSILSIFNVLDDSLRQKVFSSHNVLQSFQCILNILIRGNQLLARHYAVDLLKNSLTSKDLSALLSGYKHLPTSSRKISSLLVTVKETSEELLKIYDFFLLLLQSEDLRLVTYDAIMTGSSSDEQQERASISDRTPVQAVVRHASHGEALQRHLPPVAFELLISLVKVSSLSDNASSSPLYSDSMMPDLISSCLGDFLKLRPDQRHVYHCRRLSACLDLMCAIVSADVQASVSALDSLRSPDTICRILDFMLDETSLVAGDLLEHSLTSDSQVMIVLRGLYLLHHISSRYVTYRATFNKYLKDRHLTPLFAYALTSQDEHLIQCCLAVLQVVDPFNSIMRKALSKAIVASAHRVIACRSGGPLGGANSHVDRRYLMLHGDANHGLLPPAHRIITPNSSTVDTGFGSCTGCGFFAGHTAQADVLANGASLDAVDRMIKEYQSKLMVKDPTVSEMIQLYERKIAALETKEARMHELLEAKAGALLRGDVVISQHRRDFESARAENTKLRAIIHDMEVKCEHAANRVTSIQQEQSDMAKRCRMLQRALQDKEKEFEEADNDFNIQLNQVKAALESTNRDLASEKELHDVLRKHFDTLKTDYNDASSKFAKADEELKLLRRQKKDGDAELRRYTDMVSKLEVDLGTKEEEVLTHERNVEKLRGYLQELEAEKKQLHKQIKELEKQVRDREADIRKAREELSETRAENEKVVAIQKMIQKLANEGEMSRSNTSSAS